MRDVSFLTRYPIAHRGYYDGKSIPENSLPAFKKARDKKYAIELDIQLTKDNRVVVFHDNTLQRMCGKPRNIKDYTYAELQEFSLGNTSEKIPLFKDVLNVVNGIVPIVVELKHEPEKDGELPALAYELLKNYKGEFVVQSFNPMLVAAFTKIAPEFLRGVLVCDFVDSGLAPLKEWLLKGLRLNFLAKPDFINTDKNYFIPKMKRFKKKGGTLICYTAGNEKEYEEAFKTHDNVIFEKFEPRYFYTRKHIRGKDF